MNRYVAALLAMLLVACGRPTPAAQPPLPARFEDAVAAAIERGDRTKQGLALEYGMDGLGMQLACAHSLTGICGLTLVVQGPLGRVQTAAAEAARRYQRFALDSAGARLAAPVLTVRAEPLAPRIIDRRPTRAADATHVVLVPLGGSGAGSRGAVQPLAVETFVAPWSNLVGGSGQGQGVTATFALRDVPDGDFEIVVVTTGAEARFKITARERPFLR